ncbi:MULTISPECIES: TetR/AcrR family transcriptional regulator [Actinomycetes]|uniref:TetR/AcrR family transcriptional regulator n=2 Tax=Actinomycetes TaxID=1760 RepID=A0ABP6LPY3_9MICC|nr:TetR/AcrR family transcriptional regulator [Nesterenkonia sp. CL21]MDS2171865.1 TetR/AcrR family transcriptional regulator [Nesterenkonia sp. CL21]
MNDSTVPDLMRRQWRLPASQARQGRKPRLDLETVITTAVELADTSGLDAVTLPRISDQLGVTAMSLYRHIGSKEDLLHLMMDAASELPGTSAPPGGWRPGLRQWALDLWDLYVRRPWIPRIPVHRAPSGPHQIAWLERGLEPLAATRLTWREKIRVITLLSGFVRQSILLMQDLHDGRPAGQAQAEAEHEYGSALTQLVTADRFPQVAEMLASSVFPETDEPTQVTERREFIHGLDLVLDGLEVRIEEASAAAG